VLVLVLACTGGVGSGGATASISKAEVMTGAADAVPTGCFCRRKASHGGKTFRSSDVVIDLHHFIRRNRGTEIKEEFISDC